MSAHTGATPSARGGVSRARLHGCAPAHLPPFFHAPAHALSPRARSPHTDTAPASLFLTTGELERQKAAGVYFLRQKGAGKEVSDQKPEEDISYATLPARAMEGLQVMLHQLYLPLIETESKGWKAGVVRRSGVRGEDEG